MPDRRMLVAVLIAVGFSSTPAAAACSPGHVADGNDCDWRGTPSYISGTWVYSRGEFIYSDFVHDDAGANVDGLRANDPDPPQPVTGVQPNPSNPTSPDFGGAANDGDRFQWSGDFGYPMASPRVYYDDADILEFREALDHDALHFLVRLGAMSSPDSTVIGIGIDADRNRSTGAGAWPLGANMVQQLGYDYFITMWGTGGEITDYTKQPAVTVPIKVVANTKARPPFMEADVPLPPNAKLGIWRTYVGSGLWDAANHRWSLPLPAAQQTLAPGALTGAPYIYNLLFRPYEANTWWHDDTQAQDLGQHDISEDHADINMKLLASRASTPEPHPTGLLNVQYRTLALGEGQGVENVPTGNIWRGPVEPYSIMVPSDYYSRPHARRFMFFFHCAFCNQNVWAFGVEHYATPGQNNLTDSPPGTQHVQQIVNENDMLVGGALQRGFQGAGSYGSFPGAEERDLRDVENAIRTRFDIDPNEVMYSGMSMGGLTTQTMMTLYPDELASAIGHDSCPLGASGITNVENIRDVPFYEVNGDTGLDSPCGATGRQTAQALDTMGYRHMYIEYLGRAHDFGLVYDSLPILEGTAYREVRDPNPARVTYTLDAASEDPKLGLVHDHAYWINSLKLPAGATSATIDATALAMTYKLPRLLSHLNGYFLRPSTGDEAYVDWQVWNRDLTGHGLQDYDPRWQPSANVTVTNTHVPLPTHAGANGFTMTTSYGSQTLVLVRMGIKTAREITGWIDARNPTRLTLNADGLTGAVTLDGRRIGASRTPRSLTVEIPAGNHVLAIAASRLRIHAGCPAAAGALKGRRLGSVVLDMTRGQARRAYRFSSERGKRYEDFFCLTPIGVRVGYASPKLLRHVAAARRRRLAGRVVWISTADQRYLLDGVRAGVGLASVAPGLDLGRGFHVGLNWWYFVPGKEAEGLLKVRHGVIEEIGIADKSLTGTRRAQYEFITSFS